MTNRWLFHGSTLRALGQLGVLAGLLAGADLGAAKQDLEGALAVAEVLAGDQLRLADGASFASPASGSRTVRTRRRSPGRRMPS